MWNISRSACILFCALGCVENKLSTARACKGLMMNKCAVEGLFSASILSILLAPEEIYKSSKGVNLLNGLNLFFSGDDSFFIGQTFGKDNRVANTTNDQFTIKLGTNGAGLNYSLNIFNDNYDRTVEEKNTKQSKLINLILRL